MSDAQFILAILGLLVAIAVPVRTSKCAMSWLDRKSESKLSAVVRAMGRIVTEDGNRALIDSVLEESDG